MKTFTLYDSLSPMFRSSAFRGDGFGNDPLALLDRVFETGAFLSTGTRNPAADVRETEKAYFVDVELPGLSEKDLKLELKDGILSLSTAVKEKSSDGEPGTEQGSGIGKWLRRERREFAFARSFLLPEDADGEAIQARLRDGLLAIELPKKPETAPRIVPVKVA